jgi:hypothetical protein
VEASLGVDRRGVRSHRPDRRVRQNGQGLRSLQPEGSRHRSRRNIFRLINVNYFYRSAVLIVVDQSALLALKDSGSLTAAMGIRGAIAGYLFDLKDPRGGKSSGS